MTIVNNAGSVRKCKKGFCSGPVRLASGSNKSRLSDCDWLPGFLPRASEFLSHSLPDRDTGYAEMGLASLIIRARENASYLTSLPAWVALPYLRLRDRGFLDLDENPSVAFPSQSYSLTVPKISRRREQYDEVRVDTALVFSLSDRMSPLPSRGTLRGVSLMQST